MNAAANDRPPALDAADLESLGRVLADRTMTSADRAALFPSRETRLDAAVLGWNAANLKAVRRIFREERVPSSLRLRAWAGMLRRRNLWESARTAVYRRSEQLVRSRFAQVYEAQMAARAEGGLSGLFQFGRLWEIARIVAHFQPTSVLECGTGASTAMFSTAMRHRGPLLSVEESPYWHDRLQDYIRRFAGAAESICAQRILTEFDGEPVVHYAMAHDRYFDLVYVDGPSNEPPAELDEVQRRRAFELDRRGRVPNVDIELMWRGEVFPRVIVVDGRLGSLRRWARHPAFERYDVVLKSDFTAIARRCVPDYYLHHTILVRRDEPGRFASA